MSYRNAFFEYTKTSRELNHSFRKFQISKLPRYVTTKAKTKMIEVPIEDER